MRQALVDYLVNLDRNDWFLLTGDLGFQALEPVRDLIGTRFINCGVAEQNMCSMAAGLAKTGRPVLVYSISPFLFSRANEQIRNDICFHRSSVCLLGNGGGFGYGVMGPSHHGLDDLYMLSTMPYLDLWAPSGASAVHVALDTFFNEKKPTYIRLAAAENYDEVFLGYGFSESHILDVGLTLFSRPSGHGVAIIIGAMILDKCEYITKAKYVFVVNRLSEDILMELVAEIRSHLSESVFYLYFEGMVETPFIQKLRYLAHHDRPDLTFKTFATRSHALEKYGTRSFLVDHYINEI